MNDFLNWLYGVAVLVIGAPSVWLIIGQIRIGGINLNAAQYALALKFAEAGANIILAKVKAEIDAHPTIGFKNAKVQAFFLEFSTDVDLVIKQTGYTADELQSMTAGWLEKIIGDSATPVANVTVNPVIAPPGPAKEA